MASDTEKIIRDAAFKVFSQKGFAAASMRDIANEAGVNHALINYYYDSKVHLFYEVMVRNIRSHISYLKQVFDETDSSWKEKIQKIIDFYTDYLLCEPDNARFIFNEMAKSTGSTSVIIREVDFTTLLEGSVFKTQLTDIGLKPDGIVNLMINAISLVAGPVITAPVTMALCGIQNQDEYISILRARKQEIIPWLEKMFSITDCG